MEYAADERRMLPHGARQLPCTRVNSYNLDIRIRGDVLNNRVRKQVFIALLDDVRRKIRAVGKDPFGDRQSASLGKKAIGEWLTSGNNEAAAVIHAAIEEFAEELARIVTGFLRHGRWKGVERIVIGGGFRQGPVGELTVARAGIMLKSRKIDVGIVPIHHHPDEAGLIGAVHLLPPWMLKGHDGLLAVDIGGTNIRAGVILFNARKAEDFSKASVWKSSVWRHADEKPSRTATVKKLAETLQSLRKRAEKAKLTLVPIICVGCPGVIQADGTIARGGSNLPGGNWEGDSFNLPRQLADSLGEASASGTILMHNDAVVQGLSEVPRMKDVKRWGVLTIGTGLGNACYENQQSPDRS